MRPVLTLLCAALAAQAQAPLKLDKICPAGEAEAFGLTCSEDEPCPVFLELASVEASGSTLFLTGNLHTVSTTLSGLMLASDDGGKTWTEPAQRIRAAALDQIQFVDFQHGWVGGIKIEPLPKDPFLLATMDGGKTWRQIPLFEDTRFGSILKFWFDSAQNGQLVFDRSQGESKRYELYQTMTGGASWELQEVSEKEPRLAKVPPKDSGTWRLRADADSYRVEERMEPGWKTAASFAIRAGDCR